MKEHNKKKILENLYELLNNHNIDKTLFDHYGFLEVSDDYNVIYNTNKEEEYLLTMKEVDTLLNLKHVTFEEFNKYYYERLSVEEKEIFLLKNS